MFFQRKICLLSCLLVLSFNVFSIDNQLKTKKNDIKITQKVKKTVDNGGKIRVIAKLKQGNSIDASQSSMSDLVNSVSSSIEKKGIKIKRRLKRSGAIVLEINSNELDQLIKSGKFEEVQEDKMLFPTLDSSISHIGVDLVHNVGLTGSGQAVAVLDTGVDTDHSFFANRLVAEACFSSNSIISGASTICPNGLETQVGQGASEECSNLGVSGCDHGTHVAGIAIGNSYTEKGVAINSNLVAVQVFSQLPADHEECIESNRGLFPCLVAYGSDIEAALEWVLENAENHNISSVNMSLGGGKYTQNCDDTDISRIINDLKDAGIATVIASGNDSSSSFVNYPGCVSSAITVGNIVDTPEINSGINFPSDSIWLTSNSSAMVDILAPGRNIRSSVSGGGFSVKTGTSMAAPHVAGAFAIMKAINPNASVNDIEISLKTNAVSILDSRNNLTFPRLDMHASAISFEGKPIASLDKESYSVILNKETSFTGAASSDPNNLPLTFTWDFGDGDGLIQTSISSASYTYNEIGSYDLELETNNGTKSSDPNAIAKVTVYDPVVITIITSSILL